MSRDEVVVRVNDFLIDEFELEEAQLAPKAFMKEDLDIEASISTQEVEYLLTIINHQYLEYLLVEML